jgi:hypothetical protein
MWSMRTVLATDEMLGSKTRKMLPGSSELYAYERMRLDGEDVVRVAAMLAPCVLAIGAKKWDPLDHLERWRLGDQVLIVALLPKPTRANVRRAIELGARAIVPVDGSVRDLASAVFAECVHAWDGRQRHRLRPVLVSPSPARQPRVQVPGRVLQFVRAEVAPGSPEGAPLRQREA